MLIKKILNNNVVLTETDQHQEVVAMGSGIAYKKSCGDNIPEDKIDKIYTLSQKDTWEKFKTLLTDISMEYMEVSTAIIEMAEKKLKKKLNESIYISLTDHIHMAVTRFREGCSIRNMMIWEIQRFYPAEYAVSEEARDMINTKFSLELPIDEAGFIALHIIDAQMENDLPLANHITQLIQEITNIVRYTCSIEYDIESLQYYRFITHLKFFAKRMFIGEKTSCDIDEEMTAIVQNKYGLAHRCAEKIAEFLQQKYQYELNRDEKFYLMIHIAKVSKKS
jgi:beta-glucoside operon transcriptional antiterminator